MKNLSVLLLISLLISNPSDILSQTIFDVKIDQFGSIDNTNNRISNESKVEINPESLFSDRVITSNFILNNEAYEIIFDNERKVHGDYYYKSGYVYSNSSVVGNVVSISKENTEKVNLNIELLDENYDFSGYDSLTEKATLTISSTQNNECDTPPDLSDSTENIDLIDDLSNHENIPNEVAIAPIDAGCFGLNVINVMIAYSPEAFDNQFDSNSEDMILNAIAQVESLNDAFVNSSLSTRARLSRAFVLSNSEIGNKDDDWDQITSANGWLFDYVINRSLYKADASFFITDQGSGGRADRPDDYFIYTFNSSVQGGLSHELGHGYGCGHHRGSYEPYQQWVLDSRKAYGWQGQGARTLMVQNTEPGVRMKIYSSNQHNFPNPFSDQVAGNDRARAANRINDNPSKVNHFSVSEKLPNDPTFNTSLGSNTYTNLEGINSVRLLPGFNTGSNSELRVRIAPCLHHDPDFDLSFLQSEIGVNELSQETTSSGLEELIMYPNPALEVLKIQTEEKVIKVLAISLEDLTYINLTSTEEINSYDVENLKRGEYLIKVITENNVWNERVLLE